MRNRCSHLALLVALPAAWAQTASDFSTLDITSTLAIENKFDGATVFNNVAVFAPFKADCVGYFDIPAGTSGQFECRDTTAAGVSNRMKYMGAASTGTGKVVFAPYREMNVGIVNMETRSFST